MKEDVGLALDMKRIIYSLCGHDDQFVLSHVDKDFLCIHKNQNKGDPMLYIHIISKKATERKQHKRLLWLLNMYPKSISIRYYTVSKFHHLYVM